MPGLIFDCDGVLADTERDGHRVAFNRAFTESGLDFEWTVQSYAEALQVAGGKERMRAMLTPEFCRRHGLDDDPAALDELVAAWHQRKTEIFVQMSADGELPARPGVRRLAAAARAAGWQLAVASTSAHASVRGVLEHVMGAELAARFTVFAGDDVRAKKPAPDIYLLALQRLQLAAHQAVVVEDSAIGVRAALAAGPQVIATTSAYTADEDLSGACIVVSSLGEPGGEPLRVGKNDTDTPIVDHVGLAHLERMLDRAAAAPVNN
ncbi:HAD-IA family hydrolase [Mycolicibacterium sp.]|uniref:HAD-IA family hydrolase n=1 Tax=Mycolicibacterium sp. TaxID=2320850 RepID=UPI003D097069